MDKSPDGSPIGDSEEQTSLEKTVTPTRKAPQKRKSAAKVIDICQ